VPAQVDVCDGKVLGGYDNVREGTKQIRVWIAHVEREKALNQWCISWWWGSGSET